MLAMLTNRLLASEAVNLNDRSASVACDRLFWRCDPDPVLHSVPTLPTLKCTQKNNRSSCGPLFISLVQEVNVVSIFHELIITENCVGRSVFNSGKFYLNSEVSSAHLSLPGTQTFETESFICVRYLQVLN